jgi:hypothetical protein
VTRVAAARADAIASPDGAGPQHAPQLAGAGQIGAFPGPQREVLSFPRQEAVQTATGLPQIRPRIGKPVVRVRPDGGLLRIDTRRGDPLRKRRQLMTAPLADGRERHRVPGEIERNLIRLPGTVAASDRDHREDRTIYAA